MTTITTSTTAGSQNLRNTMGAALATIVAASISFGAWALVTSGDDSPAASAAAVTTSAIPQLSPVEEVALISQLGAVVTVPTTQLTPTEEIALINQLGAVATVPTTQLTPTEEIALINQLGAVAGSEQ